MSEPHDPAEAASEDTDVASATEDTAQAPGEEQSGDDAAAAADEGQADRPKPKQTAQERINELTRRSREAERDRDFYREQALRNQPAQAREEPAAAASDEPSPDDFEYGENDLGYIRAVARYEARVELTEQTRAQTVRATVETKLQDFQSQADELFPDGEPAGLLAFRALPQVPHGVTEAILASDIGPKIADHIGANPRELRRISGLSPALQAREITLIEARLKTPSKPIAKTATDAPEAPPQARGGGGRFSVAPDTNDFAAFEKAYP